MNNDAESQSPPFSGLFLESIRFRQDYRCFVPGDVIPFHAGLNFLVGDQGTGKSTVIQLIREAARGKQPAQATIKATTPGKMLSLDFERELPRGKNYFDDRMSMQFQMASLFSSHGEVVRTILGSLDHPDVVDHLVVMDEPDIGLSPRSCHALGRQFVACVGRGCQVIASIHSPIVMGYADEVLSMEHWRWMTTAEFLESQVHERKLEPKKAKTRKAKS